MMNKEEGITISILVIVPLIISWCLAEYIETIGICLYAFLSLMSGLFAVYILGGVHIMFAIIREFYIKRKISHYAVKNQINILYSFKYTTINFVESKEETCAILIIGKLNQVADFIKKKHSIVKLNILEKLLNSILGMFNIPQLNASTVYSSIIIVKGRNHIDREQCFWNFFYQNGFYLYDDDSLYSIAKRYNNSECEIKNDYPILVYRRRKEDKQIYKTHLKNLWDARN